MVASGRAASTDEGATAGGAGGASTKNSKVPTVSLSPAERRASSTAARLSSTPFVLCRSRTIQTPARFTSSACWRETEGSGSTMSLSTSRPRRRRAPESGSVRSWPSIENRNRSIPSPPARMIPRARKAACRTGSGPPCGRCSNSPSGLEQLRSVLGRPDPTLPRWSLDGIGGGGEHRSGDLERPLQVELAATVEREEGGDHGRAELAARARLDLGGGASGIEREPVGPRRGHRVEGVRHRDD